MHGKRRVWCSRSFNGTLTRCSITRQLHTSPQTHIYSVDGYKIHKKPTHQQKYKVLLYSAAVLFWLIWWCIFLPSSSIIGWETFFKWDFFNQPITSQETRGLPRAPLPPPLRSSHWLPVRFWIRSGSGWISASQPMRREQLLRPLGSLLRGSFCCSLASVRALIWDLCAHWWRTTETPKHAPSPKQHQEHLHTYKSIYFSPLSCDIQSDLRLNASDFF